MKIEKWISSSVYYDVDTGEVLKITNERQLKYLNYYVSNKTKKTKIENGTGTITIENECKFTGQRKIDFS